MNTDVVIIGAGPAGIFTALEMLKKGSRKRILIVEKGKAVEDRHCPRRRLRSASTASPTATSPPAFPAREPSPTASSP